METFNMPTDPVYRFEIWPDHTFDHPDCVRLITSTLPYFDPTVWVFPAGATDEEKVNAIIAEYQLGRDKVLENPLTEPFSYKQYRNDYLVGIHTGVVVDNGEKGKTYTAYGTFLCEDDTGSREWAKSGTTAFLGLEEFMNQYDITFYKMALAEGHYQIDRNRAIGIEPLYEEFKINAVSNLEEKVYVYNMFDMIDHNRATAVPK